MPEVHHAAARHGSTAKEGREEKSLQQGVLLGVWVDREALEAVDGGRTRGMQQHLLRFALGQGVVRLEEHVRHAQREPDNPRAAGSRTDAPWPMAALIPERFPHPQPAEMPQNKRPHEQPNPTNAA